VEESLEEEIKVPSHEDVVSAGTEVQASDWLLHFLEIVLSTVEIVLEIVFHGCT